MKRGQILSQDLYPQHPPPILRPHSAWTNRHVLTPLVPLCSATYSINTKNAMQSLYTYATMINSWSTRANTAKQRIYQLLSSNIPNTTAQTSSYQRSPKYYASTPLFPRHLNRYMGHYRVSESGGIKKTFNGECNTKWKLPPSWDKRITEEIVWQQPPINETTAFKSDSMFDSECRCIDQYQCHKLGDSLDSVRNVGSFHQVTNIYIVRNHHTRYLKSLAFRSKRLMVSSPPANADHLHSVYINEQRV